MSDTVLGIVERTGNKFGRFENYIKLYSLNDQQRDKQKFGGTPVFILRNFVQMNDQLKQDYRNSSDFRRQK